MTALDELTEKQKMGLIEVSNMSVGELPKDYTENHKNIWRAFHIGKEQQDADLARLRAIEAAASSLVDCFEPSGWGLSASKPRLEWMPRLQYLWDTINKNKEK